MKTFMGIYRPSDAMFALADGLEQRQDGQLVDMASYGHTYSDQEGMCFGCAATWTLQRLHGKPLPNSYFVDVGNTEDSRSPGADANRGYDRRADALSLDTEDLYRFEEMINLLRMGTLFPLMAFFEIHEKDQEMIYSHYASEKCSSWKLTDFRWKEDLPAFRRFAELLQEMGF